MLLWGPNPRGETKSASRFGPPGGPNPLADMVLGGPNRLADLVRGDHIRGGPNPLGHRQCFIFLASRCNRTPAEYHGIEQIKR